VIGKENKSR